MTRRTPTALLIAIAVLGSAARSASAEEPPSFADWTTISANTAAGTLPGAPVSLSGTHVFNPPVSTLDGSAPFFADETIFTPAIARGDAIQIGARPSSAGYATYTLTFGAPVTDPRLHVFSLGSRLDFPPGTQIARVSGQPNFTVSGASVVGDAVSDSSGNVKLVGSFKTITFAAVQLGLSAGEDGVILQVGAPAAPPPPPPPASLVARVTVSPNPTCVGSPTVLDASGSTAGAGGPIRTYAFSYTETDVLGHPRPMPTVLASSASPTASVRFPWSHPTRAATTTQPAVLSRQVREPATVVLTITDAAGVTASASADARFAQTASTDSRAGCPPGEWMSGRGNETPEPKADAPGPLTGGGRVLVPLGCSRGATVLGCIGTVMASATSLGNEIRRSKLRRQLERTHDHLANAGGLTRAELLRRENRLRDELKAIKQQLERLERLQRASAVRRAGPRVLRRRRGQLASPDRRPRGHPLPARRRPACRGEASTQRPRRTRPAATTGYACGSPCTPARAARSRPVTLTAPGG